MATVSRLESGPHRLCNEFERLVDSQPLEDFWPFLFFISVDVDDYESHHRNVKIIDGIVSLRQRHWIMKEKQMEDVGADYGIAGFFFLIDPLDRDRDGSGWRSEFSFGAFLFLFVFLFFYSSALPAANSALYGLTWPPDRSHAPDDSAANRIEWQLHECVCVCVCVCTSIRSLESGNDYLSMDKIRAGRPSVTLVRRFHFFFLGVGAEAIFQSTENTASRVTASGLSDRVLWRKKKKKKKTTRH